MILADIGINNNGMRYGNSDVGCKAFCGVMLFVYVMDTAENVIERNLMTVSNADNMSFCIVLL